MMKSQHINSPFARALRQQSVRVARFDAREMTRLVKERRSLVPHSRNAITIVEAQ